MLALHYPMPLDTWTARQPEIIEIVRHDWQSREMQAIRIHILGFSRLFSRPRGHVILPLTKPPRLRPRPLIAPPDGTKAFRGGANKRAAAAACSPGFETNGTQKLCDTPYCS